MNQALSWTGLVPSFWIVISVNPFASKCVQGYHDGRTAFAKLATICWWVGAFHYAMTLGMFLHFAWARRYACFSNSSAPLAKSIPTSRELFLLLVQQLLFFFTSLFLYFLAIFASLMISILIHFIVIATEIAGKIRQPHSHQNSIDNIVDNSRWAPLTGPIIANSKPTIGNQNLLLITAGS